MYFVQFNRPNVVTYQDPRAYDQRVRQWLTFREAENSYFLGHLTDIASKPPMANRQLFTVEDAQKAILAAGVLFPNGTVCLTWATQELVEVIADHMVAAGWQILNVFAPVHVACWLAEGIAQRTGQRIEPSRAERIYQLAKSPYELPSQGHLEVATAADRPFVREWVEGFINEASFEMEMRNIDAVVEALIPPRLLYLWKSPQPVAMAAWVAPTPHGASINFVYTPPEFRGQGYGKAVTAALAAQMLASGLRYCFVLTDVDDVRSNAIYQAIGGRTVCEFMRYAIVPKNQAARPAVSLQTNMTR